MLGSTLATLMGSLDQLLSVDWRFVPTLGGPLLSVDWRFSGTTVMFLLALCTATRACCTTLACWLSFLPNITHVISLLTHSPAENLSGTLLVNETHLLTHLHLSLTLLVTITHTHSQTLALSLSPGAVFWTWPGQRQAQNKGRENQERKTEQYCSAMNKTNETLAGESFGYLNYWELQGGVKHWGHSRNCHLRNHWKLIGGRCAQQTTGDKMEVNIWGTTELLKTDGGGCPTNYWRHVRNHHLRNYWKLTG